MTGKDRVLTWFQGLKSHQRVDLLCSLLQKCIPFELRFIGTVLENLGRQNFSLMKDFEVKVNNLAELSEFQSPSCVVNDSRVRQRLAPYICLLHSLNTACATAIHKCLYGIDINEVVAKARTSEEKIFDELLLIYTVAVNHPAFSFEQCSNLGSILLRLTKEAHRLQIEKLAESVNADYTQSQLDGLETARADLSQPSIPPGLGYPPNSYFQLPYHSYIIGQHPLPTQPLVCQMNAPVMGRGEAGAYASPHMSQHSSPSQSTQHSRNTSPMRKQYQKLRPMFNEPPPAGAYADRSDAVKVNAVLPDHEVRNLNERLIGLSTEDMLRGAAVSLNGIAAPPSRVVPPKPRLSYDSETQPTNQRLSYENEMAQPANQRIPYENEAPQSTNQRLPFDAEGAPVSNRFPYDPDGPQYASTVPRTPLINSRFNQKSSVKEGSHVVEENRTCSSSSSGSDASSTSHSPPTTPATLHRNWDVRQESDEQKSRVGMQYGRARMTSQGIQTLPRERVPLLERGRREGPRSAPPTPHEENKTYTVPPPELVRGDLISGPGAAAQMPFSPFLHGPFSTAPPIFPPYNPPPTFVRPYFPNGEVIYAYHPPQATPFPPSALMAYSSSVPPPKIACSNCSSQTHLPNDCKEPTMEECSRKGQYRIDYGKANEPLDK